MDVHTFYTLHIYWNSEGFDELCCDEEAMSYIEMKTLDLNILDYVFKFWKMLLSCVIFSQSTVLSAFSKS